MIGDYQVRSVPAAEFRFNYRGNTAVNRQYQRYTGVNHALQRILVQTVTVIKAIGDEIAAVESGAAKKRDQQGGPCYSVHIIVAVDTYLFAFAASMAKARYRGLDALHQKRIRHR